MNIRESDEFSPTQAPPSPNFYGFGPETVLPSPLVIETEGVGDEEMVIKVSRKRGKGRPRKGHEPVHGSSVNPANIVQESSRSSSSCCPKSPTSTTSASVSASWPTPSVSTSSSSKSSSETRSRQTEYLLGNTVSTFGFAKLPKGRAVLGKFLTMLKDSDPFKAATETVGELLEVWSHHFERRLIFGHDSHSLLHSKVIITDERYIRTRILDLWKDWKDLRKTSLRPDRASKPSFLNKEENFVKNVLDMPFSILCRDFESNMMSSGISAWKEDLEHLHNQLQKDQVGSCGGYDAGQKKKDSRKQKDLLRAASTSTAISTMDEIEEDDEEEEDMEQDEDYVEIRGRRTPVNKVDVMGPVSATADRLGLSVRERAMMSASVANALGVDISTTNISPGTAFLKGQSERLKLSASIMDSFQCPDQVVVHWDGKILTMKGNKDSNRVAVYISGVDDDRFRKLLGCPETKDGTGKAEADVVKTVLRSWNIGGQVCGLVFDTTSSNTGVENGACKFLEDWLDTPLLWLACRHHMHELHVKRVLQGIFGQSIDPGVPLFRRLKSSWDSLDIDYDHLQKFDLDSVPQWMQAEAKAVLDWAVKELFKNTWPRADYKELLELTIVCLGGIIPGFKFRLPGPDHHARWMSKCIYILKLSLLLNVFKMSDDEKVQVVEVSKYILILYVKHWFESPLPTAAARNDLSFMVNILKYRLEVKPSISFSIMQSCYRHLWYLVPQTVVFALADPELSNTQKENMAKKLHSLERNTIPLGKPQFPVIDFSGEEIKLPDLSQFLSPESWLVFDKLGLAGSQDWLTVPPQFWTNFQEFRKFSEFVKNISVCNDIAERGVSLITTFINKTESEEQRQAMLQVVEHHKALVTDTKKSTLKLC